MIIDNFSVTRIAPDTYHILDAGNSSFYIVEGKDRAAVIDTGISAGKKIRPIVEQLTKKPLILLITHAHGDHFYHMDEFETVYMSHREFDMPEEMLSMMMGDKKLDIEHTIDIKTNDVIDLGGESIEVCEVPGHTPGTVIYLAKERNLLFTGDAIGSGYGVWMQVPGAVSLDVYYESLVGMLKWCVDRGGRMKFYGGHNQQQTQSTLIPGYNPLGIGLLADLIDLVDGLRKGTLVGRMSNEGNRTFHLDPDLYACYGRAEIQYNPDNIH